MQQMIFIAGIIACSTYFGHHFAHHQELEIIIQVVAACRIWCLVFKFSVWCGAEGCVSGLRAAESKLPGTLWATPGLLQDCCTFTFYLLYYIL